MNLDRLGSGERIAGISALLLFVFMFFDWFGSKASEGSALDLFSVGRSAWDALDYIPIVLLIAIAAPLAVAGLRLTSIVRKPSAPASVIVAILGVVSVLLILFRIVHPPTFGSINVGFGPITIEGTVQFPIYLALLAAAGIAFGGCWAMREERGRRLQFPS